MKKSFIFLFLMTTVFTLVACDVSEETIEEDHSINLETFLEAYPKLDYWMFSLKRQYKDIPGRVLVQEDRGYITPEEILLKQFRRDEIQFMNYFYLESSDWVHCTDILKDEASCSDMEENPLEALKEEVLVLNFDKINADYFAYDEDEDVYNLIPDFLDDFLLEIIGQPAEELPPPIKSVTIEVDEHEMVVYWVFHETDEIDPDNLTVSSVRVKEPFQVNEIA